MFVKDAERMMRRSWKDDGHQQRLWPFMARVYIDEERLLGEVIAVEWLLLASILSIPLPHRVRTLVSEVRQIENKVTFRESSLERSH